MDKKLQKIVATSLATLTLAAAFPAFAAEKDYKNHWAEKYIDKLVAEKVIKGYQDGSFKPNKEITREEVAQVVFNYIKAEAGKESKFTDVKNDRWSYPAISALSDKKIINGYKDGSFKPLKDITREEFSTLIYNYISSQKDLKDVKLKEFTDIDKSYAKEYIQKLAGLGLILGYENGEFKPQKNITRAEVAKIISEIEGIKKEEKKEVKKDVIELNDENVKKYKDELKAYLDSMDEKVLEDKAIATEANKEGIKEIKDLIKRAKELLADEKIDEKELQEIAAMPFRMVDGKKQKGTFNKATHNILVDYAVDQTREVENKDNHKKYPKLQQNQIKIKTSLEGAGKIGENDKKYFKLNYVTKAQYDAKSEVDAVSGSTPRYEKQELPKDKYTVEKTDYGYVITVKDLPEDVKILKPIVYVNLAEGTKLENGDLVYVD